MYQVEARAAAVAVELATSNRAAEQAAAEVATLKAQVDSLTAALKAAETSSKEAGDKEEVAKDLGETKASLAKVSEYNTVFFLNQSKIFNTYCQLSQCFWA